MDPLAVLVVSPDPLARSGLAALVVGRPELALAGEAAPSQVARVGAAGVHRVVLWDMGTGTGTGAGAGSGPGSALPAISPGDPPVVALCVDEGQAGRALRAGARGVLSRGAPAESVAAALQAAVLGLAVLDPALAAGFVRPPEPGGVAEPLTPREREVLALLAEGLANKAIAARLGISEHTAKFHVNAILAKLEVDSRAEAIVRAARLGLVSL